MINPDPNRLGGLEWARRTRGALTSAERRRLIGAIAVSQVANLIGRTKLALGKLPEGATDVDVRDFEAPDSQLAREAEAACAEQSDLLAAHSYRTWLWGMALAAVDRQRLDRELFYCAALVHDWGATTTVVGEDFTIRGAERALACADAAGIDPARANLIADGICCHTTPGVTVERDGAIAYYVQYGAMVDGAGLRAWDVAPHNIKETLRRHPRGPGFKRGLSDIVRAEARAMPEGRFGLARRYGMTLAVHLAPFDS
ncbi:hypothetical protein [Mycobacterium sp. OTB74]|uniref:hypothetical protein n=1 Tax=Mycobacterium sp. OTB74 TaxID=1853452 RepID=UPI00247562ED|nr:hypothetical protein [Mycobacterium sp. OTB74]MDH6245792.1 hypothetical protein [Mycobacterium sp. OTB74]